ncbi:tRNA3(Ser)-specific nuclease WapA precursor [Paenibacillus sp. GM1FR]|uniref:RHS repeat-associated core domain-containing protein n=1 Tax=Paenibacillus sp. GM1FR TaxID=2059267 RepID=UPI000C27BD75|nr:RHS repeat-associated core domain-containing protein [Paenibacillus sp. GM1FR]PJN53023.1 tRNA3(Ser)-specific nuclease WapA precursor [Paenibacillus sp. GM1FR]
MKQSITKKYISILLIVSVFSGLFGNWIPAITYAEEQNEQEVSTGPNPSPLESISLIAEQFDKTEGFIQDYLDQGYTLNEVISALYKARDEQIGFDEALQAVRPQEVNESASVTSDVYTDSALAEETPLTGVEADQSSIMQRYETFAVEEELTAPPDTDLEKENEPKEEEDKNAEDEEKEQVDPDDQSEGENESEGTEETAPPTETTTDDDTAPQTNQDVGQESTAPSSSENTSTLEGKPAAETKETPSSQGGAVSTSPMSMEPKSESKNISEKSSKSVPEKGQVKENNDASITNKKQSESSSQSKQKSKSDVKPLAGQTSVPDPGKHIAEKAPVYSKKSFNEAPYTVGENGETISTMSGGLMLEHVDASLPGRAGMSFSLERQYNSNSAQFYDPAVGTNTYEYPVYNYFLTYQAVKKKIITKYHVKYKLNKWVQEDYNGDGLKDNDTIVVETPTILQGTYTTEADARKAASTQIAFWNPSESRTEQQTRSGSLSSLPSSISYNQGGFSGTLNKSGSAQVISGQYQPARTITAPTQTCTNSIPGKYDSKGVWTQTGSGSPCPDTKTATVEGKTITLTRSSVTATKACPSPDKSVANYVCTKTWEARYNGSVSVPESDTRVYSQSYVGSVVKPGQYSQQRYDSWIAGKAPYQYRYAYSVREQPWVEQEVTEGPAESITLYTDGTPDWSAVNDLKNNVNSNAGIGISTSMDSSYNYYLASSPSAEIRAYQVGSNFDVTYYNKTVPAAADKRAPLGKGWSWKLPYIETENGKSYMNMADGGRYEIAGNTLKGYDWEGIAVKPDTSATVNGETSSLVVTSSDGITKQYFSADGRLLQISDGQKNDVQFLYENNSAYNSKLLTQVKDTIGNTIRISYTSSSVTIVQGNRTVTYNKQTKNGIELLDSVIDPLGRKTTYSYKLADAKFNLPGFSPERAALNPYALLTSVQHNTGAKTFYEYENGTVKRYIGEDSFNDAYRVLSRKDQITYENGSTEDFNRQTYSYTSDIGTTFSKDTTFAVSVSNGLTNTQYNYRKDFINNDTPAQFYLDGSIVSAEGKTQTTTNTYGKTVKGRSYAAPTPTVTTLTDNQAKDVLTTILQLDDYGNITSVTDATGRTTTSTYDDTRHWLTSVTDMVDATNKKYTALTRDNVGNIKQIVNRTDNASGELLTQADYTYDTYGNLLTQRISDGKQERNATLEYDSRYQKAFPTRLSMMVTDVDGKITPVSTSSEYDMTTGDLISSTDAEQRTTKYRVDAIGRTIEVTQTDETKLRADYDDINNTIRVTDELGQQRLNKWNSLGQAIESGYFSGNSYVASQRTGYDPYGRPAWTDDALGNRIRNTYDNWSRVVMITGADGTSTSMKYDDVARTATSTDAEGYMQVATYDKWGKGIKTEEKTQLDQVLRILEKNKYDNISGQPLEKTDGNGNVTALSYDVLGQLRQVTGANGEQTQYSYDMAGNLLKTIDPAGNIKENTYDQLNRRIQTKDKSGNSTRSYYAPGGNLTKYVDRNGNEFTYEYDLRGNLIRKISSDETISFAIDAVGKRISMTDRTGTTGYEYDSATEQLTRLTYPDGLTTEFTYDLNGNRTEMKEPFGNIVYYTYDEMNRMKSVGTVKDAPDAQYTYYQNGLFKSSQSQNGVNNHKTYNGLDLVGLEQVRDRESLGLYNYSYDNNKNITKRLQHGVQDDFSYDQLDRIVTASGNNEQYTYDKQGNRLTMQSDKEVNAVNSEYQYDTRNRLSQVTTDTTKVGYQYNGNNLLVERTENGVTTRYYYDDGAQIIAEAEVRNGKPELKATYIRGARLEAIVYADGNKAYVQTNGHGDIVELRDENGKLLNQYDYDIWGNILFKEENVHNPFRYAGELWDDATNLQYLRARWYDPAMGRFINEDSYEGEIDEPLSQNLYSYVENNPLTNWDPTGNWSTGLTANWTINEMKLQWEKAKAVKNTKSMTYWSNETNKLRNQLRASGVSEANIMKSSDSSIPEAVVKQIAGQGVEAWAKSDPIGFGIYFKTSTFLVPSSKIDVALAALGPVGRAMRLEFRSTSLLDEHFQKHVIERREFGPITKAAYLQGARDLFGTIADGTNILTKTRLSDRATLIYNRNTNEFLSISRDGYIKTYFKPSGGLRYYNNQGN